MREDGTSQGGASKPKRQYQRQRFKKQFTVRIDEDLAKAVLAKAEDDGLRLTDAMEEGLWLWIQKNRAQGTVRRGRFLWNLITLEEQKELEGHMIYIREPDLSPIEEAFLKYVRDAFLRFRESARFEAGVQRLSAIAEQKTEDRSVS